MAKLPFHAETKSVAVKKLVERATAGGVRIPVFQRPLSWKSNHVIDLLDSVWRGYPIGSLLMSKRAAEPDSVHFGRVALEAPAVQDAWWVVDGQQRLTALVATLDHPDEHPAFDIHAIWFDLVEERFFRNDGKRSLDGAVPVRALGSMVRALQWSRTWPLAGERLDLVKKADEVGAALRDFEVPVYVVESEDDEVLGEIFRRSNTSGVAMKQVDVFDGLYRSSGRGLGQLQSRLDDIGFEEGGDGDDKEKKLLLSCYRAVVGAAPEHSVAQLPEPTAASLDETERAVRAAALQVFAAGFPNLRFLPYAPVLQVLSRYFAMFPDPSPTARSFLSRFLWCGAISRVHAQMSDSVVRDLFSHIKDDPEDSALRLLDATPVDLRPINWRAPWNARHAETKLAACVLVKEGMFSVDPKTPLDGVFSAPFSGRRELAAVCEAISQHRKQWLAEQTDDPDMIIERRVAELERLTLVYFTRWAGIDEATRRSVARMQELVATR